jgi:thymidylate kinase
MQEAPKSRAGQLIVIEGSDATGKRTLTEAIVKHLRDTGRSATSLSFPDYESPVGALIDGHLKHDWSCQPNAQATLTYPLFADPSQINPFVRQILMIADMFGQQPNVAATLSVGTHVVMDRYYYSALVYGAASNRLTEKQLGYLTHMTASLLSPSLAILLDADPEITMKRREARDDNERDLTLLKAARICYMHLWPQLSCARIILNAEAPAHMVAETAIQRVDAHLNLDPSEGENYFMKQIASA